MNNKTKPNKKHTNKQTKTHNTKQTEQGKSGRQTSYVTSVMNKRDILVSSLFWAKVVQFPYACVAHFFNTDVSHQSLQLFVFTFMAPTAHRACGAQANQEDVC